MLTSASPRPDGPQKARVDGPADTSVVGIAESLTPLLVSHAKEAQESARPADAAITALADAGMFTLLAPAERGGRQASLNTLAGVHEHLARGCASTAWVTSIYNASLYMLTVFPDEAQDEVYAAPHPRVMGTFSPSGSATEADGGYRLTGTFRFCSGQHHADWALLVSLVTGRDGAPARPAQFLVPRDAWVSADDWQVAGLTGTGSVTVSTDDVFVPAHRVYFPGDPAPGQTGADERYFGLPVAPFFSAASTGVPLGLASRALDLLMERIQKRGITYTQYARQADAAVTHLQLDEAWMKLDQARFHAARCVSTVVETAVEPTDLVLRARCRADTAWVVKLCREVVEVVQRASGASAIHRKDPLSIIVNDIQALSVHALMLHSTNAELYGRVLSGLDPATTYI